MKSNLSLFIIKLWAAIAWADTSLSASRRKALKKLIERAVSLSPTENQTAQSYLKQTIDIPPSGTELAELPKLAADVKKDIYICALQLARLDSTPSLNGEAALKKLRTWLQLDEVSLMQVNAMLPK